ncbi:uncharacterized protein LOC118910067 [Manis pentadactyla]|uniref:uncharacterized protein LOC118910067 n=1 Tax=Manis pentadactyla TaxID=143292 RepID=UPI00255C38BA|nr:uncharacterized protein LOC118910067 [Manis pentadactyla]
MDSEQEYLSAGPEASSLRGQTGVDVPKPPDPWPGPGAGELHHPEGSPLSIGVAGPLKDLEGDVSAPYASLQGGTSGTLPAAVILSALCLVHRSGTPEHCVALEVTGGKALSPLHGGGSGARPLPPAAPASLPAAPVAALLDLAQNNLLRKGAEATKANPWAQHEGSWQQQYGRMSACPGQAESGTPGLHPWPAPQRATTLFDGLCLYDG